MYDDMCRDQKQEHLLAESYDSISGLSKACSGAHVWQHIRHTLHTLLSILLVDRANKLPSRGHHAGTYNSHD